MEGVKFVQCSISSAPFRESQFDVVYSNHVIEHIADLPAAFKELRRIGKPDCLYAFSVPTNIWLLFSIPAHYYKVFRNLGRKMFSISGSQNVSTDGGRLRKTYGSRFLSLLLPSGHGVIRSFPRCYRAFRISNWTRLFSENRFSIVLSMPLLLYGPSEWPVIPTTECFNRFRICSSILFLLKKHKGDQPD